MAEIKPRTETDVLKEWAARGYTPADPSDAEKTKCLSYIRQARDAIFAYCNIPERAAMPPGLFYTWTELSHELEQDGVQGGAVKSITEGNTTVTFAAGETTASRANQAASAAALILSHTAALNRYRRMP